MKPLRSAVDEALLSEFDTLVKDANTPERELQRFLEEHPEFFHTPHLLNHGLHCDALISQFRLNTSLTADFAYLTKSSNVWRLVLVELEPASLKIFTQDEQATPSAAFTKRKTQIDEWRVAVKNSRAEIESMLKPLLKPMGNDIEFFYVLVIGASPEPFSNPKLRDRMNQICGDNCQILTWDSLRRSYVDGRSHGKNILSINKGVFSFKHLLIEPPCMFSHMKPYELSLSADDEALLKKWGYCIDDWKSGQLLKVNEKYPSVEAYKASGLSIFGSDH